MRNQKNTMVDIHPIMAPKRALTPANSTILAGLGWATVSFRVKTKNRAHHRMDDKRKKVKTHLAKSARSPLFTVLIPSLLPI